MITITEFFIHERSFQKLSSHYVFFQRDQLTRGGFRRGKGRGGRTLPSPSPLHLLLCNHFEELQTVLFEVELIINNAPLTYLYPNTIETCLTLNHLLFDRRLLYSSNTTSTVVRNLTVLSNTTDNINRIST